jgi:hypothetical protein
MIRYLTVELKVSGGSIWYSTALRGSGLPRVCPTRVGVLLYSSTVQYHTVPYCTVRYFCTVQYWYSTVSYLLYGTVLYSTIRSVQYSTGMIQYCTVQYSLSVIGRMPSCARNMRE